MVESCLSLPTSPTPHHTWRNHQGTKDVRVAVVDFAAGAQNGRHPWMWKTGNDLGKVQAEWVKGWNFQTRVVSAWWNKQGGPRLHQFLNSQNMQMHLCRIRYGHSSQRAVLEILCQIIISPRCSQYSSDANKPDRTAKLWCFFLSVHLPWISWILRHGLQLPPLFAARFARTHAHTLCRCVGV